jgi:hypothetical protein
MLSAGIVGASATGSPARNWKPVSSVALLRSQIVR